MLKACCLSDSCTHSQHSWQMLWRNKCAFTIYSRRSFLFLAHSLSLPLFSCLPSFVPSSPNGSPNVRWTKLNIRWNTNISSNKANEYYHPISMSIQLYVNVITNTVTMKLWQMLSHSHIYSNCRLHLAIERFETAPRFNQTHPTSTLSLGLTCFDFRTNKTRMWIIFTVLKWQLSMRHIIWK